MNCQACRALLLLSTLGEVVSLAHSLFSPASLACHKLSLLLVELELGVHRVREEVGVDEDRVGRAQGGVGLEEQRGADLGHFALGEFRGLLFLRFEFAVGLVFLSKWGC